VSRSKKGKGRPMDEQAAAILRQHLDLSSRHAAKLDLAIQGSRSTGRIHSLRTFDKYASCLELAGEWAKAHHGLRHLSALTPEQAQEYLEHRTAEGIGQKQLDADRNALEFITGKGRLERVAALTQSKLSGRAYTPAQVDMVQRCQSELNALSTRIAYEAGLRAHELLTLRRTGEERPSGHRTWRPERFDGREGVRYVVTGKGGLKREVLLSRETAERLEARRLAAPREILDRGVRYLQVYDISGGNRWAVSFSAASERALGWSTGAHGLRHSYAQERMRELAYPRMEYYRAREVVSQEMGHFRGEIVETYLR
jgi:integrase